MLQGIRSAVIIHNPTAGNRRGRRRAQELETARRIFAGAGIETVLRETRARGAATELARSAATAGFELVIVCGGDGTLNEAVNGLAGSRGGSQVPLAVLPAGTANVMAKELGIPWDIPRAAELILRGTQRRIALGEIRSLRAPEAQRYFLSVAGAGPDGAMVYSLNPGLKLRTGIVTYWVEGFGQLFHYNFPRFRVASPGRELEATLVVVGRTKHYGGPFRITTEADLFENSFELAVLTTRSRAQYLSYLPALWLGLLRSRRGVYFWKTTSLRCEPLEDETVYAQADGEPAGRLPVEFRIVPDALTLVVPEAKLP